MVSELRHCRHGHEVPERASLCPTCGDGGSLGDTPPGLQEPSGPWVWIVVGALVSAAGLLAGIDGSGGPALVGIALLVLGQLLLGIGVVAQGVLVGLRRWHHESPRSTR